VLHCLLGALVFVQLSPALAEAYIELPQANNLFPLADEATPNHVDFGGEVLCQVAPESGDVHTNPVIESPGTAASLVPSDEDATETQLSLGASVSVQFVPESEDV
jgi:hypothetical protein